MKKKAHKKIEPQPALKITQQKRDRVAGILAVMIGLLSVIEGGRVLSGLRIPAYPVIPWLIWYNVGMGLVSVAAGAGLWSQRAWSQNLAINILTLHAIVFGGIFAMKMAGQVVAWESVFAMMFRTFAWIVISMLVRWRRQG